MPREHVMRGRCMRYDINNQLDDNDVDNHRTLKGDTPLRRRNPLQTMLRRKAILLPAGRTSPPLRRMRMPREHVMRGRCMRYDINKQLDDHNIKFNHNQTADDNNDNLEHHNVGEKNHYNFDDNQFDIHNKTGNFADNRKRSSD